MQRAGNGVEGSAAGPVVRDAAGDPGTGWLVDRPSRQEKLGADLTATGSTAAACRRLLDEGSGYTAQPHAENGRVSQVQDDGTAEAEVVCRADSVRRQAPHRVNRLSP